MYVFTARFRQVKEKENVVVWQSELIEKTVIARSYGEVTRLLQSRWTKIDIQSIVKRVDDEIELISSSIVEEIWLQNPVVKAAEQEKNRKQDSNPIMDKPSNVFIEEDENVWFKRYYDKIEGNK